MAQTGIHILRLLFLYFIMSASARPPKKIINGDDARIGEFPHQVSVQENGAHICGGSIIDPRHILTAAHCLVDEKFRLTEGVSIVVGTTNVFNRTADNVFPAAKLIYHPDYDVVTQQNDIGIVKLARPIPIDDYQRPIKLPSSDLPDSTSVMTSGWGAISWNETTGDTKYTPDLQKLATRIINNDECRKIWNQQKIYLAQINSTHICALTTDKASGICFADSGGPLTYNDEIVGVASFVVPCAKGFPDVYTRVDKYLSWISSALTQ